MENLVVIIPGSKPVSDGVKATGTVTFATNPLVNDNKVTIDENTVNAANIGYKATAAAGIMTIEAKMGGVAGNVTITKTGANISISSLTSGNDRQRLPSRLKVASTSIC